MEHEQCSKKAKLENTTVIKEGKAEILVTNKNVFYNPVQEFNRDLSAAVLSNFARDRNNTAPKESIVIKSEPDEIKSKTVNGTGKQEGITVLEALSATGLRSIRYAKEVKGIKRIVANDIAAKAVESIKQNIQHNGVEDLVVPSHEDATMVMYQHRKDRFDVVDLDPYGCPSIFLDGAVQCLSDGGLLMITATDMAVLAGNSPETCYVKYGAISLKSKACHEIALRILLQHVASHAGRYGRYIVPILSISADFYIRIFVKIFSSQLRCKANAQKIGMMYQCSACESITTQPFCYKKTTGSYKLFNAPCVDQLCKQCCRKQHVAGPLWLDSLHDQEFVSQLLTNLKELNLGTAKRIEGVLNVIREELDVPLYYSLARLMSIVRCHTPSMLAFRSALINAGYNVSYSHANKMSIKTDAPNEVIWDVVRAWEKQNPINRDKLPIDSPAIAILNTPSTTNISFSIQPHANPLSRQNRLTRFQVNPTVNWGPGTRSTTITNLESGSKSSKKVRNQNKKRKKEAEQTSTEKEAEETKREKIETDEQKVEKMETETIKQEECVQ